MKRRKKFQECMSKKILFFKEREGKMEILKEYLEFYEKCYKDEKEYNKKFKDNVSMFKFRKGKTYEMGLVIRDLKRIISGDLYFKKGEKK